MGEREGLAAEAAGGCGLASADFSAEGISAPGSGGGGRSAA